MSSNAATCDYAYPRYNALQSQESSSSRRIDGFHARAYPSVGADPPTGDHGDVVPTGDHGDVIPAADHGDVVGVDHGNVVPVQPERTTEADMPRRGLGCAACNASLRAQSPKHTRVAGSCRFPHIDSKPYKCPACTAAEDKYMNPRRNAKGHTHTHTHTSKESADTRLCQDRQELDITPEIRDSLPGNIQAVSSADTMQP